jgi:two-component system chemotaxis response regulator CheB
LRDITVIGASAGGLGALRELFAALPADYPAAIFVVLHVAPEAPSVLPAILNRSSKLPVSFANSNVRLRRGTIVVAPPDHHLVLEPGGAVLSRGPRENRHRPSIDVLFRSAAVAFGARVTGVVLSGMLDDGSAGLWAIKRRGGAAVVQDPDDAEYPDMPRNAMQTVAVDLSLPICDMAPALVRIAHEPVEQAAEEAPPAMASEVRMATQNSDWMEELDRIGQRVPFTCPECGGSLWEMGNGGPRFRCHNGHAYSLNSLASEQAIQVEAALWAGLRRLEESERLSRQMESYARARGNSRSADYHADMAQSSASHAETLRRLITEKSAPPGEPATEPAAVEPQNAEPERVANQSRG